MFISLKENVPLPCRGVKGLRDTYSYSLSNKVNIILYSVYVYTPLAVLMHQSGGQILHRLLASYM